MKILFQGDSITDAWRSRDDDVNIGVGYPLLIKACLGLEKPGEYEFINRGIGRNRIVDLYALIKNDIINIKPDVMSILIGVNDVWHDFFESPNGVEAEKYYNIYDMLIGEVKEALHDIKIIIMEPFVINTLKLAKTVSSAFSNEERYRGDDTFLNGYFFCVFTIRSCGNTRKKSHKPHGCGIFDNK